MSDIYGHGYLPYSGDFEKKDLFYMARSARISLENFIFNSENRRIAKKFDGQFQKERIPLSKFNLRDEKFLSFCVEYFEKRHGPNVMPRERLLFILESGLFSDIVIYKTGGALKAYIFEPADNEMSHFWYSFYDLELIYKSLGMYLMVDAVRAASDAGKRYFYLGTVYGDRALYKTNFDNLEWWTGSEWSGDTKKLKELSRSDKG